MQTIYIDISNKGVIPTIYAKQGDVGRKFEIVFTDSGLPYTPPNGSAFSVWYSGTSGEGNYTDIGDRSAFSINANKVSVEMIAQMLENFGDGVLCLVLNESNGNQIGSWNIPYMCEQVPGIDSEEAKSYYTAFSEAVANLPYPDNTLSVAGKAADAAATGEALAGKAPVALGAPHNYLDNSDFRNPVNQRGATEAYQSILVDRWWVFGGTAYLTADGITGDGGTFIAQRLPIGTRKDGKTYTLVAYYSDGTVYVDTDGVFVTNTDVGVDLTKGIYPNGKTITHVALYEGEYTAETLPEYKPKGYGVELAECMRYYQACDDRITIAGCFDGNGCLDLCYPLSMEMRTNPTVICNANGDNTIELYVNGEYTTVSVSYQYRSTKYISPRCINGGWANKPCFAAIKFVASADL